MSRRLFWRLVISLLLVALLLFSGLLQLSSYISHELTRIAPADQQRLRQYADRASLMLARDDSAAIARLTERIAAEHNTWSAVMTADSRQISGLPVPLHLRDKLGFHRKVGWPVHPFMQHVLIGIPLAGQSGSFIIELPDSMHPRPNLALVQNLSVLLLSVLVLGGFCWLLYRHLMQPLEALSRGARRLAGGDLSARVLPELPGRRDELGQVAGSFDSMADRIERLVSSQRQLLGDLSHELRTPLTRIELALDLCQEEGEPTRELLPRLRRETEQMRTLVEDALTLAWLDDDPQIECGDRFELGTLLELICDDAAFEFPDRSIRRQYAGPCPLVGSNQRALAQSLENVLRNALKYSPVGSEVVLECRALAEGGYRIEICDQGPGVPEEQLEKIFEPFFRTDKARSRSEGGFGLGLALARRQIQALGGRIHADNRPQGGLRVVVRLPSAAVL